MATPASPTPKQLKEIQLLALQDPDRLRSANVNNPDRKYSIMDVVFGQDAVLGYFHFVWQQMKWERKARKAEEVAIKAAVAESLRSDAQVDPLDLARQQSLVSAGIVVGQEQGPLPPYTPAGAAPAYSP